MDRYVKAFIKASLVYLGVGIVLGVLMMVLVSLRFPAMVRVHSHLLLLGFVAMMIYGIGYSILPGSKERPGGSPGIRKVQFWLANITLVGLLVSWIIEVIVTPFWHPVSILFAIGQVISVFLFIIHLWDSL